MLTIIIKGNAEPSVIEFTYSNIVRELKGFSDSHLLVSPTWKEALHAVTTPYVMLVEADCTLSSSYVSSNLGIMAKMIGAHGGGYTKVAMLASCLGVKRFDNRIYSYKLAKNISIVPDDIEIGEWVITTNRHKHSTQPYYAQVGFVPGAIIRMRSIGSSIDELPWDHPNMVEMSTRVCFHLWNTNRHVLVNPNTTYVSTEDYLQDPPLFGPKVPHLAASIFEHDFTLPHNSVEKI